MSRITITYSELRTPGGGRLLRGAEAGAYYGYSPCFEAKQGSVLLSRASVWLTLFAADLAGRRLEAQPSDDATPAEVLEQLLISYGTRRMEASVRDMHSSSSHPDLDVGFWKLTEDDLDELYLLLPLVGNKTCDYQQPFGRDLMCTATAAGDPTATQTWNGRLVAPTSRAICRKCALPESTVVCSNLLHPAVKGDLRVSGLIVRHVLSAMCDLGREELNDDISGCRAGGHACWERHVAPEPTAREPVSPLSLPEQFDVLDAYWRLNFGKRLRLLDLHTVTGAASLALGCGSRAEFESRLSALADIIDKLQVDDGLLPAMTEEERSEKIKGSLDKLQIALNHKLPAEHRVGIEQAVRTLRQVRQARNAMQHGIARDGGLTAKLRELGIHDAPPNWEGAWDTIRALVSDALSALRNELRGSLDAGS